ncbi:MAG: hypothetical protein AAF711_01405 [Planctomycetota bacterium]
MPDKPSNRNNNRGKPAMIHRTVNARRRSSTNRHGFASFSAVVLVGTTALALTALARVTTTEIRRTSNAATDTQLRQFLLAGQLFLHEQTIKPNETGSIDINLPESLEATSSLTIHFQFEGTQPTPIAIIEASHRQRRATSEFVLMENNTWQAQDLRMP